MPGFIVRTLISALGLWLASAIVPGVEMGSTGTLILAAILLGVVNALIRPIAIFLTLPLTLLTLGLFLLVVNAGMLGLVAWLLKDFHIEGFFPALLGALVVSFTAWFASSFIGTRGSWEVMIFRR